MTVSKLFKSSKRLLMATSFALTSGLFCQSASATIVQIDTVLGPIKVNLYDETTPETVNNFLNYVNSGAYSNSVIHRAISGFIIQGGGFVHDNWLPSPISSNAAIINEPVYSNVRGTIAMAKTASNPNSATNQWFFNLANNSANLDNQNSGFTVFGEVIEDGMTIVDQIAALQKYNFSTQFPEVAYSSAFTDMPLRDFTEGETPNEDNIIIINEVTIIDSATDTAANSNPPLSTAVIIEPPSLDTSSGSFGAGLILLLVLAGLRRKI